MYEAIRHLARYHQINEFNSSNRAAVNRAIDHLISDSYIDFNAGSSIHTALSYLTFPNNYIDFNRGFSIHNPLSHLMIPKKIIHEGRVQEVNANHLHDKLLKKRKNIIKSAEAWERKNPDDKEEYLYGLHNGYFVLGKDGKTIKYSYLAKNKRVFAEAYETGKDYEINLID